MKDNKEVVQEFNEIVNMTAPELEKWLKSDDSRSAGWPKENEDGESVGHDSGRKIVEILKANPKKEAGKYTDEQVQHMRKVVSYCKRHLAQEEKSNNEKSAEEVKQTKSYASLKNWGHDPLKARGEGDEEDVKDDKGDEKQTGDKRKKGSEGQNGSNKKRETRSTQAKQNGDQSDDDDEADEDEDEDEEKAKKSNGAQKNGQSKSKNDEDRTDDNDDEEEDDSDDGGANPKKGPKKGDTVSWNWGSGNPKGKVLDVKGEKTSITTKRGNEVTRDGDPEDPAVVIDTGKSKAIKSNHELN